MHHVIEFLRSYLRGHWEVLRHAQIKDSTLAVLALLEKCGVERPLPVEREVQAQTPNTERLRGSRLST